MPPITPVEPTSDEACARVVGADGAPLPPDFRAVFEQNAPFVWRILRRLGVGEADVQDVCQEVFVVVHRKLGEFDGRAAMPTWLYGICTRMASDYRRRAHVRREQVMSEVPDRSVPADQDRALEKRRAIGQLDAILGGLSDDKRAIFVLYELEGLPMSEVATTVGCPLQTAYSRLHAAREHVQAEVLRLERSSL